MWYLPWDSEDKVGLAVLARKRFNLSVVNIWYNWENTNTSSIQFYQKIEDKYFILKMKYKKH